jgi:hypothetical protein
MTKQAPNKYSEAAIRGIERLKEETTSLDGWEVAKKSGNLTIYNKPLGGSSIPVLLRGDATFTPPAGATPGQILRVALSLGARLQCNLFFLEFYMVYNNITHSQWHFINEKK